MFFGESDGTPLCYVPDYEQAHQFLSSGAKKKMNTGLKQRF